MCFFCISFFYDPATTDNYTYLPPLPYTTLFRSQPQLRSRSCNLSSTQNSQPANVAAQPKEEKSTARSSPFTCCASICLTSLGPTHRRAEVRSEEHTSELQSLMRISYAVFCLKKKTPHNNTLKTNRRPS